MKRISICIPTWEQHGVGMKHLIRLITSIEDQTFTDYEIIISDHSKNDDIQNYISGKDNLNIIYVRNSDGYGNGVVNANNSIRHATGDLIKMMFQDDHFYSPNILSKINDEFDIHTNWIVNASNITYDGINYSTLYPHWNDRVVYGVNTMGCPSSLTFRNNNGLWFDENLTMLMDTEYFYQLYKKFGPAKILNDVFTTTGVHPFQISILYDKDINEEIAHINKKHNL